jgi:hypothetical protein
LFCRLNYGPAWWSQGDSNPLLRFRECPCFEQTLRQVRDEGKVPVTALVQLDPSDARHLAELAAQRGLTLPQFLYETAMTQLCVA